MERPTLEYQIRVSKMTYEECIEALRPKGLMKISFWLNQHAHLVWCVIRWRWYDKRTGVYSFKENVKSLWTKGQGDE